MTTAKRRIVPEPIRAAVLALLLSVTMPSTAAFALSEIQPGTTQPAEGGSDETPKVTPEPGGVPTPDPIKPSTQQTPAGEEPADSEENQAEEPADINKEPSIARPSTDPNAPPPEVQYDLTKLPEPVQRMRKLLVDVAISGDIEKLRPLIGTGPKAAQLSLSEMTEDPITYLKSLAGDEDGREVLAIMEEVLDAGYVHLNPGKPDELYVWPYFFGLPLEKLTPRQTVELFKIITAGDYEEMKTFGSYIFYRLGITPSGEWAFFVAGE